MPFIVFASPKGGVGKTTMAANVAAALTQRGYRVTMLDLDPQNALRLHFGIPLQDKAGFASALIEAGGAPPLTAFLRQTKWGIWLLPFGCLGAAQALAAADSVLKYPGYLKSLCESLLADPRLMVIVDSPPGPSSMLSAVLPYADMLVCVLLADPISVSLIPSIEDGRAFGPGTQQAAAGGRLRFVLNQVDMAARLSRMTMESARPYLGARLLGEVRRDEMIAEAAASQCPLPFYAPNSASAHEISRVAVAIAMAFGMAPQWDMAR